MDYLDFIQVTSVDDEVQVSVAYASRDVYVWRPRHVICDMDGGFSFATNGFIWHVHIIVSNVITLDDEYAIEVRDAGTGKLTFSSCLSAFVETKVVGGARWINPSSKSILMPCDGRGGGVQPPRMNLDAEHFHVEPRGASCPLSLTRSLIKRWNKYRTLPRRVAAHERRRLAARRKRVFNHSPQFEFEPQMFTAFANSFSGAPGKISAIIGGINDVTRAVHHAAVNGVSASDDVFARLDGLTTELGRFNDNCEGIRAEGIQVNHSVGVNEVLRWCYEHRFTIGLVVLVSLIFILALRGSAHQMLISALCALVGALVVSYGPDVRKIWDEYGPNLSNPVCVFEPQMFDNPVLKSALLLSYIFGFRGLCVETLTGRFDKFCAILSDAPRRSTDIMSTISFYLSSLQDLFNQTLAWCGVDYSLKLAPDKYPQSTALLEETTEFLRTSASSKELVVEQAARVSQVLQARIGDMLVKNKSDHEFAGDRLLLMKAQSKLETYDRELELRGAGRDVTRVPPKAYLFIGQPKIGKSFLLKSLSLMTLYTLLKGNETALGHIRGNQLRDYVFTRNSCDKFWEGYYNQMLVLLDEVGMQRDTAGADAETNEYANFIKMVNDVVFPLLMANVEKKGTREFNSSVILGTTNCKHFQIESINNKSAYDRRWNTFEVTVKPEYGKWHYGHGGSDDWLVPDFDKMRELGLTDEDLALSRFLEFRPRKSLLTSGYKGEAISIDCLINMIKTDLEDRDNEVNIRMRQTDILHAHFDPQKQSIPGHFEPQINDCRCKVCTQSESRFFQTGDRFWYSEVLTELPSLQFQAAFENGFDHVVDENSYLYHSTPLCVKKVKEEHPTWNDVQVMFDHGCHVKSLYLQSLDLTNRKNKIDLIKDVALKACAALGVLATVISIWKIGGWLFADAPQPKDETDFQMQSIDLNAQEVLSCVLKRNVYAIGDDKIPQRGFVTFLTDNILIMPRHFVIHWQESLKKDPDLHLVLRRLGDGSDHQRIRFHAKHMLGEVLTCGNEDFVAAYLGGRVVQKHASLRKYLGSDSRPSGDIYFPVVNRDTLAYKLVSAPYQHQESVKYQVSGELLQVAHPITYRHPTTIGDCGLPVARRDPFQRSEKIVGIHVSGSPGLKLGVATPVTQSMYDAIVNKFSERRDLVQAQYRTDARVILDMEFEGKGWNDLYEVPEHLKIPGKVNLGYAQPANVPSKTSIVPSPLFKELDFEPKTKPARLREFTNKEGKVIDPNMQTTLKYHRTVAAFDLDVLDVCKNSVTNLVVNNPMLQHHPDVARAPLAYCEAVAGIDGVEGLDGMPRKTSAGYPRCLAVEKRGKRDFFGDSGDYEFDGKGAEEIRTSVEGIIASAKQGKRGAHVFMDFPKDERRPKMKVDAGKTRKISACPIDLAICIRMMFGSFVQDFMYNRVVNQSALGVNVFDSQWDQIAQYLGTKSRIIAGDFGNYDGSLPYCLMVRFLDTVTEYYGDKGSENERARDVLFQELVNSRHTMNGVIYEWVGSNASGNPLTTVLNSWCNLVLLRYATLKCVDKCNIREAPKFLRELDRHVRFMVYGDDNLISVRRDSKYLDMLTQASYTNAFASMGFEYTDETKGEVEVGQDRDILQVSFLKRMWATTSTNPMRKYLSPLALDTILESIQWTKRADFDHEFVRDNVVNMLQELSQHDRATFAKWAPKIIEASRRTMNFVPLPNSYDECQAIVLARDSF